MPKLVAAKRERVKSAHECSVRWGGKFTFYLIHNGFHFCDVMFKQEFMEALEALHKKVLRDCDAGYRIKESCGVRTKKVLWDGGPTCHRFREKANRQKGWKAGYIKLKKPTEISIMTHFVHTIETLIGQKQKQITLVDFLLQHEAGNEHDCKWHQDMVTQGLGIIVNVGASIQGTEFLSYPGMNFNLMADWAKTNAFLKSKWELT